MDWQIKAEVAALLTGVAAVGFLVFYKGLCAVLDETGEVPDGRVPTASA